MQDTSLSGLIYYAYDLLPYKVAGPDWLETEKFDLEAVAPAGSTREQLRAMLRTMLAERFGLRMHYEKRLVKGYELTVAKGGPKFGNFDSQPRFLMKNDSYKNSSYFTDLPIGQAGSSGNAGKARVAGKQITLGALAGILRSFVRLDVEDHTGLTGTYTMSIYFDPDHPETRRQGGESPTQPSSPMATLCCPRHCAINWAWNSKQRAFLRT